MYLCMEGIYLRLKDIYLRTLPHILLVVLVVKDGVQLGNLVRHGTSHSLLCGGGN